MNKSEANMLKRIANMATPGKDVSHSHAGLITPANVLVDSSGQPISLVSEQEKMFKVAYERAIKASAPHQSNREKERRLKQQAKGRIK